MCNKRFFIAFSFLFFLIPQADAGIANADFPFVDVPTNTYYYEPVKNALWENIIARNNYFYPGRPLTRAEFITWTSNTFGLIKVTTGIPEEHSYPDTPFFSDVPKTHWAFPFVQAAKQYWMVSGTYTADGKPTGKFEPNRPLTRAEAAVIIMKAFVNKEIISSRNFPDIQSVPWAEKAIQKAATLGFFTGYPDGTFGPGNSILRAEGVTVLIKVQEKLQKGELTPSFNHYGNTCDAVHNAQFQSIEAFEGGLGPVGSKVKFTLSFSDKTFEWLALADVPFSGTYTCSDFKITGEVSINLYHAQYSGEYDPATDRLTWEDEVYERAGVFSQESKTIKTLSP